MVTRFLAGIAGALILVLASCSENSLLTPLSDQSNQITIKSVASGTMVTSGDKIPLSVNLNSSQSTPTNLKVELLSTSGTVVQSANIANADFSAPLPSVLLSSLKSGAYTLQMTLTDSSGTVLAQKKVNIFYVQGAYSLDGITSYPPALSPGSSGLIVARVTAPVGSNPYLRWTMGSKLIATGYLKDGYDKIQWTAPTATGVYSISVEMFPFGPPPGGSFDFTSPYKMKVEVFVTDSTRISRNELGPPSSYYALYHFQGNLKDSSARAQAGDATMIGDPKLAVSGSVFGYELNGTSGFSINSLLLPFTASGELQPSSITMRVRLDNDLPNRQFFRTASSDGSFSLAIASNAQGALAATIDGTTESRAVTIPSGDVTSVTLSLVPQTASVALLWFVNGGLVLTDSLQVTATSSATDGTSTIGGTNGFSGLIDEFGVYYRNAAGQASTDPEVFRRAMTEEYGSNLLFAEGFDGIYLPTDVVYGGNVGRSDLTDGLLSLDSGQSVALPAVSFGESDLTFLSSIPNLSGQVAGTVSLWANGKEIYSAALHDALNASKQVQLTISPLSAGGIKVTAGAQKNGTTISGTFTQLTIHLSSGGTAPLQLRDLLVIKNRVQLAQKIHTMSTGKTPAI